MVLNHILLFRKCYSNNNELITYKYIIFIHYLLKTEHMNSIQKNLRENKKYLFILSKSFHLFTQKLFFQKYFYGIFKNELTLTLCDNDKD